MVFGAVVVALLMVSSVAAVNINNVIEIKEVLESKNEEILEDENYDGDNDKDRPYVDPDIRLTRARLPKLRQVVEKIEDQEYRELIQKIIETIEIKGVANSKDLKNILIELNMQNTGIHSGRIVGSACCYSGMFGIPFIPILNLWIGPSIFVSWEAKGDEIGITIGVLGHHITEEHTGFALPFVGIWVFDIIWDGGHPEGGSFGIFGWSPLILVTYI